MRLADRFRKHCFMTLRRLLSSSVRVPLTSACKCEGRMSDDGCVRSMDRPRCASLACCSARRKKSANHCSRSRTTHRCLPIRTRCVPHTTGLVVGVTASLTVIMAVVVAQIVYSLFKLLKAVGEDLCEKYVAARHCCDVR